MEESAPAAERTHLYQMGKIKKEQRRKYIFYIATALFLILMLSLNLSFIENLDNSVSEFVQKNRTNILDNISIFLGKIFDPIPGIILLLIIGMFLLFKNKKEESIFLVIISFLSVGMTLLIKEVIQKSRPIIQFINETGYSFPSGHSMISVVLFGSLSYLFLRKFKGRYIYFSIISLIVGLSRVYLNVHWLSDIIGGFILGIIILSGGIILLESNIYKKLINQSHPK